jgi:4-hydroxythreonine-4-phosphate dehydrogenase
MGDPAGIGGEIILKSLPNLSKKSIPLIIGDSSAINLAAEHLFGGKAPRFSNFKEGGAEGTELIDLKLIEKVRFGKSDPKYGEASYRYIVEALKLILAGEISAIVTCPINKKSINSAGIKFIGHTELLAHYGGTTDYVMMMANRSMRVSLVTIHIPIKEVPRALSVEKIFKTIMITDNSLKTFFGLQKPHIKVCGLNPHAGEEGIMGDEETMINEAIKAARLLGVRAEGPFPADTLFHRINCDAYIAMYHDQGLIPVKTIDFSGTVNITLGLPFIRTSPGHGTGYDIAGKGIADPSSLIEAYRIAEMMAFSN